MPRKAWFCITGLGLWCCVSHGSSEAHDVVTSIMNKVSTFCAPQTQMTTRKDAENALSHVPPMRAPENATAGETASLEYTRNALYACRDKAHTQNACPQATFVKLLKNHAQQCLQLGERGKIDDAKTRKMCELKKICAEYAADDIRRGKTPRIFTKPKTDAS